MKRVNINELKAHLSEHLHAVELGEEIVICKHNVPIAELKGLFKVTKGPRPLGLAKGKIQIHDSFFDPLSDDILDEFEGNGE